MHRKWLLSKTNADFIEYLSKGASVSPVLAQILVNRGIRDIKSIQTFISPPPSEMHDPFLMPDMQTAVSRLEHALKSGEKVLVHGDYDADGVTSTALLVSVFRKLGIETEYHIPHRDREGYGVSLLGVKKAQQLGAGLIVTVDCGISSHEEIAAAAALGIDVIITDHHQPSEIMPEALAIINPHRHDSLYPFKRLAGVGVALKLVQALKLHLKSEVLHIEDYLDLAALGTVADAVSLTGENRAIAQAGIREMNRTSPRPGIKALKEASGVQNLIRSESLSFSMIPRINAAGRISDAAMVVELLLTEDKNIATRIALSLDQLNASRQEIEGKVFDSALAMIEREGAGHAIIIASSEWHAGVIGITASRLVEKFCRPVFIFSIKGTLAKGSARSIPSVHLYDSLNACSSLLTRYGGHSQAAGISLDMDHFEEFKSAINKVVHAGMKPDEMQPVLEIDASLRFAELNYKLIKDISRLEPFGEGNREPVFASKDVEMTAWKIVGSKHLKMDLMQKNVRMDSIGFSMGDKIETLETSSRFDIAYVPGINEWRGMKNIQLTMKGIRPGV
ncbi:MAG: single-stranded-DNA-specific exonuclease RecJ [Nitrospira sp.]|nr:single-stranded-DNA-specific exonuclease RecJ [bacterium]MBL7048801.1 single-stranded-DNA-specific exonuclease RecJ [Nitrospira sp.]